MTKRWTLLIPLAALLIAALLMIRSFLSASSPDETAQQADESRSRTRELARNASARTAPARPPSFDETPGLRKRVEDLTDELERQKRERELRCMTSLNSDGCPFLSPSPEMLRGMARCAVVRMDMPDLSAASEGTISNLQLSPDEQAAVRSAATEFLDEIFRELQDVHRAAGGTPTQLGDVDAWLSATEDLVSKDPNPGDEVLRLIAKERAGITAAPSPEVIRTRSPVERYWRLRSSIGDGFERELAERLGPARARQLREHRDGWTFKNSFAGECRD